MKAKYVSHDDLFYMLVMREVHSGRLIEGRDCWMICYLSDQHLIYRHRDEFRRLLTELGDAYAYVTEALGAEAPEIAAQCTARPADTIAHVRQIASAIGDEDVPYPGLCPASAERLQAERAALLAIEKRRKLLTV